MRRTSLAASVLTAFALAVTASTIPGSTLGASPSTPVDSPTTGAASGATATAPARALDGSVARQRPRGASSG